MKIFAKRKKASSASKNTTPTKRTSFESDPIVEELLLKNDPSEWNAKQKRMVKRYQLRKAETGDDDDQQEEKQEVVVKDGSNPEVMAIETAENGEVEAVKGEEHKEVSKEEAEDSGDIDSDSDSENDSNSDSDSDGHSEHEVDGENDEENTTEKKTEPKEEEETVAETEVDTQIPPSTTEAETDSDKVNPSHPVYKLLDQLNSKTKRTLSRKLDREGPKVLPEVEQEVKKLLGITDETSKKRGADGVTGSSGKLKKKNKIDWSSLSAEERLRREEQRKKQKEAAERRANGEMTSGHHKHPLNSERRRANRRKPKWKNTFKVEENKNHNASGFLARKDVPRGNQGY